MELERFIELYVRALQSREAKHLRQGQVFFNVLYEYRPDIGDRIVGGPLDPYHLDRVPGSTWSYVIENWEGGE